MDKQKTKTEERPTFDLAQAKAFLREANRVRDDANYNETVTRQTLIAGLADTFPVTHRPWWVERHIKGAERHVQFGESGAMRRGYVDSVVGVTAIEYECDLRNAAKFEEGQHQVRQYCAGLMNAGADPAQIRGVLSDGVEWYAYELAAVDEFPLGTYAVDQVVLVKRESLSCSVANDLNAERWIDFLVRHLGREGTRRLAARSVAEYLGFESGFGAAHLTAVHAIIHQAMDEDAKAAHLVQRIWTSFVAYLSADCKVGAFDTTVYAQEFYLTILARLVCANVIARRAVRSDPEELRRIIDGRYFEAKGLHRLVEHDYFGWLSTSRHLHRVEALACDLQADLAAFDFDAMPNEDVFGELLTMLAERTQRLLLGQEWTPAWLAHRMAQRLFDSLPDGESPRFVDMCCGSGAMIVAIARLARERLERSGMVPGSREAIDFLVQAATGFDIDPLAVVLAKVNWVVANRDWLEPFDGSLAISLPVYHADSLFALAPVFNEDCVSQAPTDDYTLRLLDESVTLPRFLIGPATQALFDELLERAYSLAMHNAGHPEDGSVEDLVDSLVHEAASQTATVLDDIQWERTVAFTYKIVMTLAELERNGLNGIWVFIIRNSYRPGLVAGQFNGIISNPPWLALSKIGGNPFERALKERAERYSLTPPGSAFLHLEMATTFLVHAVDHFLADDGCVACILPDTVRNGSQHEPFRAQLDCRNGVEGRFQMALDELWQVDTGVFRNRAIIIFGRKTIAGPASQYNGYLISPGRSTPIAHFPAAFGARHVWSPNPPGDGIPGGYPTGFASQGADIMPRRLLMVSIQSASGQRTTISTPERGGADWYLLSDAKKHKNFSITPRTISNRFVHTCLISKHIGPFVMARPATMALPLIRTPAFSWKLFTTAEIATSPSAKDHFKEVVDASDYQSMGEFWNACLNYRSKLTKQALTPDSWLVVYGAGGGIPAAAHAQVRDFGDEPPVIDQTLYWITTDSEDEALFLVGIMNSDVLLNRIADFIPEGDFGDRHLHTLPSMAVPQFDPASEEHVRVVSAVKALRLELHEHRSRPRTQKLFTSEVSMVARRRQLRELIKKLESFDTYASACQDVYDSISHEVKPF